MDLPKFRRRKLSLAPQNYVGAAPCSTLTPKKTNIPSPFLSTAICISSTPPFSMNTRSFSKMFEKTLIFYEQNLIFASFGDVKITFSSNSQWNTNIFVKCWFFVIRGYDWANFIPIRWFFVYRLFRKIFQVSVVSELPNSMIFHYFC